MRTDLAVECLNSDKILPEGVSCLTQPLGAGKLTIVEISTEQAQKKIGKPKGMYITMELPPFWDERSDTAQLAEAMAEALRQLLPEQGAILVAGLGNRDITPDALGPLTAEKILVTRHLADVFPDLRTVAAISPNVLGKTGMETVETVRAVTEEVHPAAVIVVDALAAGSLERLGTTVQLADSGIVPGAGVLNARKALNKRTLHVPVIALGIPTVVDLSNLCKDTDGESMMTTPRQVDLLIRRGADFLGLVINRALHPDLSREEILLLQN